MTTALAVRTPKSGLSRYHREIDAALPEEVISVGDEARVISLAGPCLTGTVIGVGRSRFRLEMGGTDFFAYFDEVHLMPCRCCRDHPHSQYPRGYEG